MIWSGLWRAFAVAASICIPGSTYAGVFADGPYKIKIEESVRRKAAQVYLPKNYTTEKKWPVVVLLHGLGTRGAHQDLYFRLSMHVTAKGFILVIPEGTRDKRGRQFWNATDACCNEFHSDVNDEKYILDLVDKVQTDFSIDTARVSIFGHSNGGFMAYRMACHAASRFAAIGSFEGATFNDESECHPDTPISILEIHAKDDPDIRYDGGVSTDVPGNVHYPSARTTAHYWVRSNQCLKAPVKTGPFDLLLTLAGNDTSVETWSQCKDSSQVAFWTIRAKTRWEAVTYPPALLHKAHFPIVKGEFTARVLDFLLSQKKLAAH